MGPSRNEFFLFFTFLLSISYLLFQFTMKTEFELHQYPKFHKMFTLKHVICTLWVFIDKWIKSFGGITSCQYTLLC